MSVVCAVDEWVFCACGCGDPTNARDLEARQMRRSMTIVAIARQWECSAAWVKVLCRRQPPKYINGHQARARAASTAVEVQCARCGHPMLRTPVPGRTWYCQRRECMRNHVPIWEGISKVVDANLAERRRWVIADPDGRIRYAEAARIWMWGYRKRLYEREHGSPLHRGFAHQQHESMAQWLDLLALQDNELGALIRDQRKDQTMNTVGFRWVYSLDAALYNEGGRPTTRYDTLAGGGGEEWRDETFDEVVERLDREEEEKQRAQAEWNEATRTRPRQWLRLADDPRAIPQEGNGATGHMSSRHRGRGARQAAALGGVGSKHRKAQRSQTAKIRSRSLKAVR